MINTNILKKFIVLGFLSSPILPTNQLDPTYQVHFLRFLPSLSFSNLHFESVVFLINTLLDKYVIYSS